MSLTESRNNSVGNKQIIAGTLPREILHTRERTKGTEISRYNKRGVCQCSMYNVLRHLLYNERPGDKKQALKPAENHYDDGG